MVFSEPIWLLLLLPLAAWFFLHAGARSVAGRYGAAAAALLILALANPSFVYRTYYGTVVVLADHSASVGAAGVQAINEQLQLIRKSKPVDWRLGVIGFASSAETVLAPGEGHLRPVNFHSGNFSNLAAALEAADEMIPAGGTARVVVLSDGVWSGAAPLRSAEKLAARGIPVDYRHLAPAAGGDVYVESFHAPLRVSPGELFRLTAWVNAPVAREVGFRLLRNGAVISEGTRGCMAGRNRMEWFERAGAGGVNEYELQLSPGTGDAAEGNNRARALVEVDAQKPVLLLSRQADSAFYRVLADSGLQVVQSLPGERTLTMTELSRFCGVILEDISAADLGLRAMGNLAAWVRTQGGGLLMSGGRRSFGAGGYYKSPLEEVLPLSLELRREHRKFSMAVVVTLDRSGSMQMTTPSGHTKMSLAARATSEVYDILNANDEMGVIAVDTAPHTVVDFAQISRMSPDTRSRILSMGSQGGGIFVYEALYAATRMLADKSTAGARHIILFADAADSEEPGAYVDLLNKCTQAGITVSVVGLGTESDPDAQLLKDVARLGGGQIYFTVNAEDLPRIFAEDTLVMSRSSFVEEPAGVGFLPQAGMLSPVEWRGFSLGGYNLCYARPGAVVAAQTDDELHAPVVAFWPVGLGRVMCYTGEINGKYTGGFAGYAQAGDLLVTLARWTVSADRLNRHDFAVTQRLERGGMTVKLHLDPAMGVSLDAQPVLNVLSEDLGLSAQGVSLPLEWSGPDSLSITVPLEDERTTLSTINVPGHGTFPLAPACLPYSPEFAGGVSGARELAALAGAGGGRELADMTAIWDRLAARRAWVELRPWLAALAGLVFLAGVFARRTGFAFGQILRGWRNGREGGVRDAVETKAARKQYGEIAGGGEKNIPAADVVDNVGVGNTRAKPSSVAPPAPAAPSHNVPGTGASTISVLSELKRKRR